ncbi:hypothetical protein GCM10020229_79260 [Kitasatospora albolonga]|uniref:GntR family transcriptional regulator n=1 Tax=Kitasatospora albolonga TaxID=68173 RepID=UPI0031E7BD11
MTLPLEDDPRPPYQQAADVLRKDIEEGRLKAGEKLPSARELQARFGLASATIQSALKVLKDERLIYSVQSRGSYVRKSPEQFSDARPYPVQGFPDWKPESADAPDPYRDTPFEEVERAVYDTLQPMRESELDEVYEQFMRKLRSGAEPRHVLRDLAEAGYYPPAEQDQEQAASSEEAASEAAGGEQAEAPAGGETVQVSAADLATLTELVTGLAVQVQQFQQEMREMRARVEQVERSAR